MTSWKMAPPTGGSQPPKAIEHPDDAQRHPAHGALKRNPPHTPRKVKQFIDTFQ